MRVSKTARKRNARAAFFEQMKEDAAAMPVWLKHIKYERWHATEGEAIRALRQPCIDYVVAVRERIWSAHEKECDHDVTLWRNLFFVGKGVFLDNAKQTVGTREKKTAAAMYAYLHKYFQEKSAKSTALQVEVSSTYPATR